MPLANTTAQILQRQDQYDIDDTNRRKAQRVEVQAQGGKCLSCSKGRKAFQKIQCLLKKKLTNPHSFCEDWAK